MRIYKRALLTAGCSALLVACNSNNTTAPTAATGTVAFTAPAGGETFTIGDTIPVVWACTACANVPSGDYMQVLAYDGSSSYLVINNAQMSDSVSWEVGSTLQSVSLLPGFYLMIAQDADGYYQAQSRFIQLASSP